MNKQFEKEIKPFLAKKIKQGVFKNMSRTEYDSLIGYLSQTAAKELEKTPAHLLKYWVEGSDKDNEAIRIGTVTHLLMEPGGEKKIKVVDGTWTEKLKREQVYPLREKGFIVGKTKEIEAAEANAKAILAHPDAKKLLKGADIEVSFVAVDGCPIKGRIDAVNEREQVLIDFKTVNTRSMNSYRGIEAYAYEMGWHFQAAFYMDGLKTLEKSFDQFVFIVVDKDIADTAKEDAVVCFSVSEGNPLLDEARARINYLKERYRGCIEIGEFPGYAPGVHELEMPAWMKKKEG